MGWNADGTFDMRDSGSMNFTPDSFQFNIPPPSAATGSGYYPQLATNAKSGGLSIAPGMQLSDQALNVGKSGIGGKKPGVEGTGLGWNLGTAQLGLEGLNTLGNLWGAFQSNKLAKKSYKLTRDTAQANLANSIASYNTNLSGMARARARAEGKTDEQVNEFIAQNSLQRNF